MDELVFTKNGVHLIKQIEVMGSKKEFEEDLSYEELNENHDLKLDIHKIEPDTDETGEFALRIRLNSDRAELQSGPTEKFDDLPTVPEIALEEMNENRRQYYKRIQNPEVQPFDTRRIIYEVGELTERELKQRLNNNGYTGVEPGKQNGSVASTLVVLDEVTNEIEREGRGEDKTLRWVSDS